MADASEDPNRGPASALTVSRLLVVENWRPGPKPVDSRSGEEQRVRLRACGAKVEIIDPPT